MWLCFLLDLRWISVSEYFFFLLLILVHGPHRNHFYLFWWFSIGEEEKLLRCREYEFGDVIEMHFMDISVSGRFDISYLRNFYNVPTERYINHLNLLHVFFYLTQQICRYWQIKLYLPTYKCGSCGNNSVNWLENLNWPKYIITLPGFDSVALGAEVDEWYLDIISHKHGELRRVSVMFDLIRTSTSILLTVGAYS